MYLHNLLHVTAICARDTRAQAGRAAPTAPPAPARRGTHINETSPVLVMDGSSLRQLAQLLNPTEEGDSEGDEVC